MKAAVALPALACLGVLIWLVWARRGVLVDLWREPVFRYPVVVVESDDWGVGPASDGTALRRIAAILREVRDATGHPAVMTLGVVLGGPDGPSILATRCVEYHRTTLLEPRYAPILEAMLDGCSDGVFALQRHGLEHCWPESLLAVARKDDVLRRWLAEPSARSEDLPPELQSRWVDASHLPSRRLAQMAVAGAVDEEARIQKLLFGAASRVAVPNTFVWDDVVEEAWAASGVACIVTPGCRFEGRDIEGKLLPATRTLRNGQRNAQGVCFVVRDSYFEPGRGHDAADVWRAVAARSALGRPTLLETHRDNFIAGQAGLEKALAELTRALQGVVVRHPKVRFMSTEALACHFEESGSVLIVQAPMQRLAVFLKRLRNAPELRRVLHWLGLGVVIAGLSLLAAMVFASPQAN
jgi:hypothetical protein